MTLFIIMLCCLALVSHFVPGLISRVVKGCLIVFLLLLFVFWVIAGQAL